MWGIWVGRCEVCPGYQLIYNAPSLSPLLLPLQSADIQHNNPINCSYNNINTNPHSPEQVTQGISNYVRLGYAISFPLTAPTFTWHTGNESHC